MVSDGRDWISLKMYMAYDQQQKTREVTCQFGHEYLSLVHDVLVLFMFFLDG